MTIAIVRPGVLSTVQDLGRRGCAAFGIPPCGAMDEVALRIANRLVGNREDLAAVELTLAGPEIRFEADAIIALAGSKFECAVDGGPAPFGEALAVRAGQRLTIGRSREGARGILALAGGIEVPMVLGSRSTCLAAAFGGFEGRPLRAGDRLAVAEISAPVRRGRLRRDALPAYASRCSVRVVGGPQSEAFSADGQRTFFDSTYRVSPRSDRMGVRLDGPAIEHASPADLLPEGIAPGAIQVPADGMPIILGVDRPTTGGYTKIATVITADLWRIAQAKPGDEVRFVAIEVSEARRLYQEREELLRSAVEGTTGSA